MTSFELETMSFSVHSKVIYKGVEYDLKGVDFEEEMVAIMEEKDGATKWIAIEEVEVTEI